MSGTAFRRALLVAAVLLACTAYAAPKDGPADAKPSLEQALKDVQKRYGAIEAQFLRPGEVDYDAFRKTVAARMAAAEAADEKAALSYLIARSYYWQAQSKLRKTRSRDVFDKYRSDLMRASLEAFEAAQKAVAAKEDDTTAQGLRGRAVWGLAQLLGTSIWGRELSAEEKEALVKRFLDVAEADPALSDLLQKRGNVRRLYANLGVEDRLDKRIPEELPDDYAQLVDLIAANTKLCSPAALKRVAEAIEANHRGSVDADPRGADLMALVWRQNHNLAKCAEYLKICATHVPERNLDLYLLSLQPDAKMAGEARDNFLNAYLASKPDNRDAAYDQVTRNLLAHGHMQECLRVIDLYENDEAVKHPADIAREMAYRRARSLDTLGKRAEALAHYKAYLKGVPEGKRTAAETFVEKRVKVLSTVTP